MDFQKILRKIAQENGTTPEEVERAMGEAISIAWSSPDPQVKFFQGEISPESGQPTPEQFVLAVAKIVMNGGI